MCRNDGYPDPDEWTEFDDLRLEKSSGGLVKGRFNVRFTESQPTGCRDFNVTHKIVGDIEFTLDLKNGEMKIESMELPEAEFDGHDT